MITVKLITRNSLKKLLSPLTSRMSSTSTSEWSPTAPALSEEKKKTLRRREYRFAYPEFLPDCDIKYRNHTRELLERRDMIARRENVMIPEFYVGSIVGVTLVNPPSQGPEKEMRFVGIVIDRGGTGLRAWMVVRNVIDGMGVEFMFDLYSPTLKEVEVLRLEKRIDEELYYLRDCDPKHSTIPTDMVPELLPDGEPVPLNDIVVPLGPLPWNKQWQRLDDRLYGYSYNHEQLPYDKAKQLDNFRNTLSLGWQMQHYKYDLMREYFLTIPIEEQDIIWEEVGPALEKRDNLIKRSVAKKALALSAKK